jgi:ABC-type dipeptide/oligopeptide/nickel transport system permease subunit
MRKFEKAIKVQRPKRKTPDSMSRLAIIGIIIVAVFVLVAIFAPWIATQDVGATNLSMRYIGPSAAHWFGTDSTGRDIFSRVVFGARISLEVGIVVVTVSAIVGTAIGIAFGDCPGGFSRRRPEQTNLRALHHRLGRVRAADSRAGFESPRV